MHPLIQTMLLAVLVSAATAGVCALVSVLVPPGRWRNGLVGFGLALAWCLAVALTIRTPRWPPMQAADWQFYAVVFAGAVCVAGPIWRMAAAWRALACVLACSVFFVLLGRRVLEGIWPAPEAWLLPAGFGVAAMVSMISIGHVARSVQAAWTFFAMTTFSVIVSGAAALAGAVSLGHAAGIFAAASGAAWIVSWVFRRQTGAEPAAFVAVVVLGGLLVQASLLGELPGISALVFAAAWPVAAIASLLLRHAPGPWRAGVTSGFLAAVALVAFWLAKN